MYTGVQLVVAFLIVTMPACGKQVPSVPIGQVATATPFHLPLTWTPSPRLSPNITPTASPTDIGTLKPTFIPTSTLRLVSGAKDAR